MGLARRRHPPVGGRRSSRRDGLVPGDHHGTFRWRWAVAFGRRRDAFTAWLDFESGSTVVLDSSSSASASVAHRIVVTGEEGVVEVVADAKVVWRRADGTRDEFVPATTAADPHLVPMRAWAEVVRDAVHDGTPLTRGSGTGWPAAVSSTGSFRPDRGQATSVVSRGVTSWPPVAARRNAVSQPVAGRPRASSRERASAPAASASGSSSAARAWECASRASA
jgi:hypothetical protein